MIASNPSTVIVEGKVGATEVLKPRWFAKEGAP
jgi:hypothetical protein